MGPSATQLITTNVSSEARPVTEENARAMKLELIAANRPVAGMKGQPGRYKFGING
jgi:hypothetical protein